MKKNLQQSIGLAGDKVLMSFGRDIELKLKCSSQS